MEVAIVRQKRTGPSKWNFTAGSRVMVQVGVYDILFGFALEGPSRTHNGNRFLVMLDSQGLNLEYISEKTLVLLGTLFENKSRIKSHLKVALFDITIVP